MQYFKKADVSVTLLCYCHSLRLFQGKSRVLNKPERLYENNCNSVLTQPCLLIRSWEFGIIHNILFLGHFENILFQFSFVRSILVSILNKTLLFVPLSLTLILILYIISTYSNPKIQDLWKIIATGLNPILSIPFPHAQKMQCHCPMISQGFFQLFYQTLIVRYGRWIVTNNTLTAIFKSFIHFSRGNFFI